MEATLTLHQAGDRLGVHDTDLNRLIRIGALPEARKVDEPHGRVWVIPEEHLPAIAARNGWTIDLRDEGQDVSAEVSAAATPPNPSVPSTPSSPSTPAVPSTPSVPSAPTPSTPSAPTPPAKAVARATTATATATADKPVAADPNPDAAAPNMTTGADTSNMAPDAAAPNMAPDAATPSTAADTTAPDGPGALVPHRESVTQAVTSAGSIEHADVDTMGGQATAAEAFDLALLDRLLATHEDRVAAQVKEQEARHALAALNDTHNRTTGELDIERRERMATADRYREERRARAVADAKVAELRDRLVREMAMADAEKEARTEAINRTLQAEREAANAVALLGWRARRRYHKLGDGGR